MQPGSRNLITDVPGILIGNAQDSTLKSGCTVLLSDTQLTAGVAIMGGAPGTRETDLLNPDKTVTLINGLVLSGGSAFGLDSASGVTTYCRENNKGFAVGKSIVPIVPGAILFDLSSGGNHQWTKNPYSDLGYLAANKASRDFNLGSYGAGTGATTANLKGGLGSTSLELPNGVIIGAIVAVNPVGSVVVGESSKFWAAPFEMLKEFGGQGIETNFDPSKLIITKASPGSATTIGIIATNVKLDKAGSTRMATAAHDGFARAIYPSHTPMDGDLIFGVSTGQREMKNPALDSIQLGNAGAICMARAIARAVFEAQSAVGDTHPTWKKKHKFE